MSLHTEQVASVIFRAVQEILSRGLNDPRVSGLTSVTHVTVSDDLANATVLVSVLPADRSELTLHGLRHAARHIRREVGNRVHLRRMPRLTFKLDESLKKQAEVIHAINEARRRDGASAPEDGERPTSEDALP